MAMLELSGLNPAQGGDGAAWAPVAAQREEALPWRSARVDPLGQSSLLRRLFLLLVAARLSMVTVSAVTLAVAWHRPWAELPWVSIALLLAIVAALSVVALMRLRAGEPLEEGTYLVHLLCDIAAVTYALSMSGGLDNAFLGFYLLPLSLASYALTGARLVIALSVTGLAMGLLQVAAPDHGASILGDGSLHETSEFVAIALAGVAAYTMARLLRLHERELLRLRESAVTEQGTLALGAMAVRTADVLSSPLATMSVLVHDLRSSRLSPADASAALDELTRQIERCKGHLSDLLAASGRARAHSGTRLGVDKLLEAAAQQCELMAPSLRVETSVAQHGTPPQVIGQPSLFDVLVLLIQYRGQPAPHVVRAELEWTETEISICLQGAAGPATAAQEAIDPVVSLTASLLSRWSGTVTSECLGDRRCSRIQLPRHMVGVDAPPPDG